MKRITLVIVLALCTAMVNGRSLKSLTQERDSIEMAIMQSIKNGHIVSNGYYSMLVEKLIDNYTKAFELAYKNEKKTILNECSNSLHSLLFLPSIYKEVLKHCRQYYPRLENHDLSSSN